MAQTLVPLRPHDIACPDRDAWLAARRRVIGASESPTILGVSYKNQSPLAIWYDKVSASDAHEVEEEEDEEGNEEGNGDEDNISESLATKFRLGVRMEPVLRELFRDETGLEMQADLPFTLRVHPEYPFIAATLDGLAEHPKYGMIVGELKNVSASNADEWHGDEAPLKYEVQLQQQMAVMGCEWGVLVALIGGDTPVLRWRQRSDEFFAQLLVRLQRFWRLVETGIRPPMDGAPISGKTLLRLHPDDDGSVVALSDEVCLLARRRREMKALKKFATERCQEIDNLIKSAIGSATYGLLDDGSCFSWKTREREASVRVVKASKGRTLLEHKKLPRGVIYQPVLSVADEPSDVAGLLSEVT